MKKFSDTGSNPFSFETVKELVEACVKFHHDRLENSADALRVCHRREQLVGWVRKFHEECGTLNMQVEKSLSDLRSNECILLMTAHQPNLFAYGGVLRKAALNHVVAEELSERLNLPVVSFFGLADQDFADDRWVRSAILPDVERRNGILELRHEMPLRLMLNRATKPSIKIVESWRDNIEDWIRRKLHSIDRNRGLFGLSTGSEDAWFLGNFEQFWSVVQEAYDSAETYADFNAFLMSRIVNDGWGYDTLFSKFSECQQIFEDEFCFLLSKFDEYSRCVRQAVVSTGSPAGGVYEDEYETVPFWYHCGCGSKVRLRAEQKDGSLVGNGHCISCGKEHLLDLGSQQRPRISKIMSEISARSLSMPLVFFRGLQVGCYVGGAGGTEYLKQAKCVAESMDTTFPPVVVWRPRDVYFGVGQMDGLMTYMKLSGTLDFSRYSNVEADLKARVADVQSRIGVLEVEKKQLCASSERNKEEQIKNLKVVSTKQNEVRNEADYPVLVRNLGLLENVATVMNMCPCIVDYAVNIGLKETSDQWVSFLRGDGHLSSNITLRTPFEDVLRCARFESDTKSADHL